MALKRNNKPPTKGQLRGKILRNVLRLTVGLVGLLALLAISFSLSQKHRSDREHAVQLGGCHRANEKQVSENKSQYADYLFFSVTAALIKVSLKHPTQPVSAKQKQESEAFTNKLESYSEAKEWRHLTGDCRRAIEDPSYKFQPSVKFVTTYTILEKSPHGKHFHKKRIPIVELPPIGALRLEHGE